MIRQRGVAAADAAALMDSDALAFVEQLDRARRHPRFDLFAQQSMRNRIVVTLDVDVVVQRHAPDPPLGVDERLGR
jgi:hypothetical protein